MKRVELLMAYLFICEECGRDNFSRAQRNEAAEAANDEFNCIVTLPETVKCCHCKAEFLTDPDTFGSDINQGGLDG